MAKLPHNETSFMINIVNHCKQVNKSNYNNSNVILHCYSFDISHTYGKTIKMSTV